VTTNRTAVPPTEDDFSAEAVRARNIARLESAGFTQAEAKRLNFLVWLDTVRDLEYRLEG
jgi:hypothetical protein